MERAILTRRVLKNFFVIDKPGTTTLPCSSTTKSEHAIITAESIYFNVYIRAITKKNLKGILKLLDESPIIPFTEVSAYFLRGIIFNNQLTDGYELPTKGENVIVTITPNLTVASVELIPRAMFNRIADEDILPLLETFKNYYNGNKRNNEPDLS